MDPFSSSSPVMEHFPHDCFDSRSASPSLSPIPSPTKTEVDVDFPVEMDESFNSSMSFAFHDSPCPTSPNMFFTKAKLPPPSPSPGFRMPRRNTLASRSYPVVDPSPKNITTKSRPLGASRTFGQDLTNTSNNGTSRQLFGDLSMKSKTGGMSSRGHRRTQSVLSPAPLKTTLSQENMGATPRHVMPRMGRRESAPTLESPLRGGAEMMDIDSPAPSNRFGDEVDLGTYFEESPAQPVVPTKRGFTLSSPPGSPSSSSPSNRRRGHDRSTSTGGLVFGARANTLSSRREAPYKRPPLPTLTTAPGNLQRTSTASAYPVMDGPKSSRNQTTRGMRRALSLMAHAEGSDDDTDMDNSPSFPDQRRYGRVTVRDGVDGSPCVRPPVRTALPRAECEIQSAVEPAQPAATYFPREHGEDERLNKILPCHIVGNDGLMRITPQTMCDLLAGKHSDRIGRFHIFDCRFDYEFQGGHIEGATNLRSEEQLDEILFTPFSGINATCPLPKPSVSGQLSPSQQTVIIFHCEFSLNRAPTMAARCRVMDRRITGLDQWPLVHYPEVYILEGGFKQFIEVAPQHCEPKTYIPMNHPAYADRCAADFAEFERKFVDRKMERTRSVPTYVSSRLAPPIALAAGSAAQGRRGSRARFPIAEENEPDSSPSHDASPTPRAVSMGQAPMFGFTRPRLSNRGPLQRFASDAMVRPKKNRDF